MIGTTSAGRSAASRLRLPGARSATLVALGASACLGIAGCGRDTAHAGAAATVGDVRVGETVLRDAVARALADPSAAASVKADPVAYQRDVLTRLVSHDLLADIARAQHVVLGPSDVSATRAQLQQRYHGEQGLEQAAAKGGVPASALNDTIADIALQSVLTDALTRNVAVADDQLQALYQQNLAQYDQVHVAHILVADQAAADRIYVQVSADPSSFAALAKQYSTDTANAATGGDLGFAGRGSYVPEFDAAVFAATPGSYLPPVHTQFGYHVIHVIERRTTTFEAARAMLRRSALAAQGKTALSAALADQQRRSPVRVNPRFGSWDPQQGRVVAATSELSSPAPGPAASPTDVAVTPPAQQ